VTMIASGELWTYLWPSLVVLIIGLTLAAVIGIATGLLLARYWWLDVALWGLHHLSLFHAERRAGAAHRAVGRFRDHRQGRDPVPVRLLPDDDQHYQGVKNVDAKLIEVGRAFRCSERQLWTNIVLPGALPFNRHGPAPRGRARPDRHGARRPSTPRSPASAT